MINAFTEVFSARFSWICVCEESGNPEKTQLEHITFKFIEQHGPF